MKRRLLSALVLAPVAATLASAQEPAANTAASLPGETQPAASSIVPPDYVIIPGGWSHPSCVHEVPNGATVRDGQDVLMNGKVIQHFEKCPYSPIRARSIPAGQLPSWNNWVMDTVQTSPAGYWVDLYTETSVPALLSSKNNTGQLLYIWSGLESSVNTMQCGVIQPVLQYGVGGTDKGFGYAWGVANWWVYSNNQHQFHSTVQKVSPGDSMSFEVYAETDTNEWVIQEADNKTGFGTYLVVNISAYYNNCSFNVAYPAVLETYKLSKCSQLPPQAAPLLGIGEIFNNIWLAYGSLVNYTWATYAPSKEIRIGQNSPKCAWDIASNAAGSGGGGESYLMWVNQ